MGPGTKGAGDRAHSPTHTLCKYKFQHFHCSKLSDHFSCLKTAMCLWEKLTELTRLPIIGHISLRKYYLIYSSTRCVTTADQWFSRPRTAGHGSQWRQQSRNLCTQSFLEWACPPKRKAWVHSGDDWPLGSPLSQRISDDRKRIQSVIVSRLNIYFRGPVHSRKPWYLNVRNISATTDPRTRSQDLLL